MTHDFEQTRTIALQRDVDELLKRPDQDTRSLTRAVANLMYSQYGMDPTPTRIRTLIGQGSMTTLQDEVAKFKEDIRRKSVARIRHPEIPADLLVRAGEIVADLWATLQVAAEAGFAAYRQSADADVTAARDEAQRQEAERERAEAAAVVARQERDDALRTRENAENMAVHLHAQHEQALARIAERDEAINQLQSELANQRTEHDRRMTALRDDFDRKADAFNQEILKLNDLVTAGDETIKRLRLDVQREVTAGERLRQERDKAQEAETQLTRELKSYEMRLARVQDQLESLQNINALITQERDRLLQENDRQAQVARAAQQQLVDHLMSPRSSLAWSRVPDTQQVTDSTLLPLPDRNGRPIVVVRVQRDDGGWDVFPKGQSELSQSIPVDQGIDGWIEVDAAAWGVGLQSRETAKP